MSGLQRYGYVWRNYFKDALRLGVTGDYVENVLRKAWDISLLQVTFLMVIPCGTNNVDQDQPKDIALGIIKNGKTFKKKHPKINTIKNRWHKPDIKSKM